MFPSLYYSLTFKIPSSNSYIDVIMIDTVVLCGNSDHDFKHLQPTGPADESAAEEQWAWIEKQLMNSK